MGRVGSLILLVSMLVVACGSGAPTPSGTSTTTRSTMPTGRSASSPPPDCGVPLQALIDAARPGAVVSVPACVYRETVTVTKSLTLEAQPGAEIRGSDVWADWTRRGSFWTRGGLPSLYAHGDCRADGDGRCLWPEQVFFDGLPLRQVASNPGPGQFSVRNGVVTLADDPRNATVEVTLRTAWIVGEADNVTVQGFTMRHAANDAQTGALSVRGRSNWTIQDNVFYDSHGQSVGLTAGRGHKILRNEIAWNGQLGIGIVLQ